MTARFLRWGMPLAALLLLPAAPRAESPQKDPVTQEEFNKAVAGINSAIGELKSEVKKLGSQKYVTQEELDKLKARVSETESMIGAVKKQVEELKQILYDQRTMLGDLAKAAPDRSGRESYVVNIKGQMPNSTFRRELGDAVNEVMRKQGTLRIQNDMTTAQYLRVNGVEYRIPPSASIAVEVPVGTVTTELAGYEPPKNWSVTPPNYFQQVNIKPQYPVRMLGDLWVAPEPIPIVGPIVRPLQIVP